MRNDSIYPADAFSGTAEAYARFRPAYPPALLASLVERVPGASSGQLLDLATGPGCLAIPLSARFGRVIAVDLEPEMISVGRRTAQGLGLGNLRWEVGLAESLVLPAASLAMITIGAAFHRLDQERVCALALEWLVPGGVIATLGSDTFLHGSEAWQRVVQAQLARWARPRAPNPGAAPAAATGPAHDAGVLERAGFVEVCTVQMTEDHTWTAETIHGYLRSTSLASDKALGANAGPFKESLISALLALNPANAFGGSLRWGYTAGRKPGNA